MTRSAPSSANKSAVAFPIPDVAPVIMATLFESFFYHKFLPHSLQVERVVSRLDSTGLISIMLYRKENDCDESQKHSEGLHQANLFLEEYPRQ